MGGHQRSQQLNQPQNVITRTRQDLINTGELFRMNGKPIEALQEATRPSPHSLSNASTHSTSEHQRRLLLGDCWLLVANLALAVPTVIALVVSILFFRDEPLADYYEYLLTLRFYWQLMFVTCLMPFILLVPVFCLLHRLLVSRGAAEQLKSPSSCQRLALKAKLLYEATIWLLVLLAFIFVAPFVRSWSLQSQLRLELDKFMRRRYESEFAYRLLDDIQAQYKCCDHLWYRANLRDQLPLSCFVAGSNFSDYFTRTCSEAISSIVGFRCQLLAGCLIVILIALACLLWIEFRGLMAMSTSGRRHYEVGTSTRPNGIGATSATAVKAAMTSHEFDRLASLGSCSSGDVDSTSAGRDQHRHGYEQDEHEGKRPLLDEQHQRAPATLRKGSSGSLGSFDDSAQGARSSSASNAVGPSDIEPIVLARANYQTVKRERSQSPMFVPSSRQTAARGSQNSTGSGEPLGRPIKSALKKATSNSSSTMIDQLDGPNPPTHPGSLDDDVDSYLEQGRRGTSAGRSCTDHFDDGDGEGDGSGDDTDDYVNRLRQTDSLIRQKQLQREQTRRSLLSVRFADEPEDT